MESAVNKRANTILLWVSILCHILGILIIIYGFGSAAELFLPLFLMIAAVTLGECLVLRLLPDTGYLRNAGMLFFLNVLLLVVLPWLLFPTQGTIQSRDLWGALFILGDQYQWRDVDFMHSVALIMPGLAVSLLIKLVIEVPVLWLILRQHKARGLYVALVASLVPLPVLVLLLISMAVVAVRLGW